MEKHTSQNKSGQTATIYERSIPFRPRAALLLDILPSERTKAIATKPVTGPDESSQEMLQGLLMRTEASAQRTQSSRMKWQLATLALAMLLASMLIVTAWLHIETSTTGTQKARLEMENQTLKEQMNTAGIQINGFKGELDTLLNRNLELAGEISKLKPQNQPATVIPSAAITRQEQRVSGQNRQTGVSNASVVMGQPLDSGRIEAIRKGTFPNGASRDELKAVLGQPDRIYKSGRYEQWVYFGRKPGRFWFIGQWLVQSAE